MYYHKIDYVTTNGQLIQNEIVACPHDNIDDAARHRAKIADNYYIIIAISTHSTPWVRQEGTQEAD